MRILIVRANETWEFAEIEKNYDLWREILQGDYEYVETGDDRLSMYCNDCGKINGLPINYLAARLRKSIYAIQDYVAGDVIVTGTDSEGNSCDISDEQMDELIKKLKGENKFSADEVEKITSELDAFLAHYDMDYYTELSIEDKGRWLLSEHTTTEVSFPRFLYGYEHKQLLGQDEMEFLADWVGDAQMIDRLESDFEMNSYCWGENKNIQKDRDSILDPTEFDSYEEYEDMEEEMEGAVKSEYDEYCFVEAQEVKIVAEMVEKFYKLLEKYGLEIDFSVEEEIMLCKKD